MSNKSVSNASVDVAAFSVCSGRVAFLLVMKSGPDQLDMCSGVRCGAYIQPGQLPGGHIWRGLDDGYCLLVCLIVLGFVLVCVLVVCACVCAWLFAWLYALLFVCLLVGWLCV